MRSEDIYQTLLITVGIVAVMMLGIFLYREIYPEYKIYQNAYVEMEKFRSTYTGEPPPEFKEGVKQIVILREDKGPETIDRCISCHVAVQFAHFSPTKIAYDINGNVIIGTDGRPVQVENEDYVWLKLDQKIAELTDKKVNQQLLEQGEQHKVKEREDEAARLNALRIAHVDGHDYDMTKVLAMHPLIGKETRPFEFHSLENYGCTSCHNGNGRGLVTDRAHGPVFDKFYEEEFEGPEPKFNESDLKNDPSFAHVFNHKPGPRLLFQTNPIFVGDLIQAKCVQCHQPTSSELSSTINGMDAIKIRKSKHADSLKTSLVYDLQALQALVTIKQELQNQNLNDVIAALKSESMNYQRAPQDLEYSENQIRYVEEALKTIRETNPEKLKAHLLKKVDRDLMDLGGSVANAEAIASQLPRPFSSVQLEKFLEEHRQQGDAKGAIFAKAAALNLEEEIVQHVNLAQFPLKNIVADEKTVSGMETDIDVLTKTYQRGKELYISQACYACHRIEGFARGGVGPELTREGLSYPWFIKESIVWPQADLRTSTMPNMKLDHEELEALMTFLLAQRGESKANLGFKYQTMIKAWEEGRKLSWEEPLTPTQMHDVKVAMEIYATQGCASCHRLKGFESNVGFSIEKDKETSFDQLYQEHQWFQKLFPEDLLGSQIVATVEKYADEIDQRLNPDIRHKSILEEIERKHPQSLEALYANFKYAYRAKNHEYAELLKLEEDPDKQAEINHRLQQWKERLHRILMIYIQEYGLGRLIGPRLNWSGIFRSDEWLMEHFWNPTAHTPRSIMPVFPFDNTKFQALTHMLNVLGKKNRDSLHEVWTKRGFNPELAVEIYCSQCHGHFLQGNGPVAEWIYPIPKNLKNAIFLRNLTKERAFQSITHGVNGTPMPPWGEVGEDKKLEDRSPILDHDQILEIVNWLYTDLPGEKMPNSKEDIMKWRYAPLDILEEIKKEGNSPQLKPSKKEESSLDGQHVQRSEFFPTGEGYYAVLTVEPSPEKKRDVDVQIEDVFDIQPAPISGPEENFYYIKKKYYTEENLQEGQRLFIENCSICHGREADGSGLRAASMQDAKPRILTNLDWLSRRDDLRLLRSIKYGVPGTAMTPWGDFTNGWQRMQLVMYIRSLSHEHQSQIEVASALYRAFETALSTVENARRLSYVELEETQKAYQQMRLSREQTMIQAKKQELNSQELIDSYQKELNLLGNLQSQMQRDQLYLDLLEVIKKEKGIYQNMGAHLAQAYGDSPLFTNFLQLIALNDKFTIVNDGNLLLVSPNEEKMKILISHMVEFIDEKTDALKKQKKLIEGKISTPEEKNRIQDINHAMNENDKIKKILLSSLFELSKLNEDERVLVEKINTDPKQAERKI